MAYFECKVCGKITDDGNVKHCICFDCLDDMDLCCFCKFNTYDFVCHPHCDGCDGKNKFVEKQPVL